MTGHVALLYSIVLTPERRVVMADLRAMAKELGFADPRTLVASGNLVFGAPPRMSVRAIETRLEAAFAPRFGRHVDIIVATAMDWRALVAANPFRAEAEAAPTSVHVRVMRDRLPPEAANGLAPYLTQGERIAIVDGHLWMHFRGPLHESKLAGQLTPKRLGIGTTRNWNTVRRLGEMLD
ncbi:MAG: DUF1697 domain-containing protein [Phreatobacter sp.]|uniref:DUF1697 domain-containing protein n=1 Tax=Phreatobacter sp. TaxID=1966341 RepID=UPI001A636FB8|nr:DUF1697 domain-containing protein [Phreatobacter sp.]MBL8570032.1 DUF1697 domain-containing protein [Phreatobacter sp.]